MDHQRSDAVVDAVIECELDAALAVEPSPEFLARVRTRVAAEPRSEWRLSWTLALAGAAVAMVAVAVALSVSNRSTSLVSGPDALLTSTTLNLPASTVPSDSGATATSALTVMTAGIAPEATSSRHQSTTEAGRLAIVAANAEPEVLIDAGESAALRRFLAGVREGRVDVSPLPEAVPATVVLHAPAEIVIVPVGIEPLIAVEGARQ
jgi:hypothetical protein